MENPYTPPKTKEPQPQFVNFFDRIAKYQHRLFYIGITVTILSVFIPRHPESFSRFLHDIILGLGIATVVIAIGSILPVVIWGFIKDRENRR